MVNEIEDATGLAQSKVSYHLGILRDAGLISSRQDGRWNVYALERKVLYRLGGIVQEALADPIDLSHVPDCRAQEERALITLETQQPELIGARR